MTDSEIWRWIDAFMRDFEAWVECWWCLGGGGGVLGVRADGMGWDG